METSFTDVEKRFVLAEMIKASRMDVRTLVEFIRNHNLQPDWLEMQLPMGRNMHQCLRAAESMFNMHIPPPPMPPLKRKSIDDLNEYMPAKRQAVLSPVEPQAFQPSRSFGMPPLSALSQPVNIQPRPSPNGHATSPGAPASASPAASAMMASPLAQTARKRGRPSKAEMEARARQRASHSTHNYTPIKAAPVAIPVATAPHSYSPRPSPMSAYQISGSGQSDTRPKTTESLSPAEKVAAPEAVPRPVQGPPSLKSEPGPPPGPERGSVPRSARDLGPIAGPGPSPGPGPGSGPSPGPGPGQGANPSHHVGATTPGLGANSASQAKNESPMSVAS